MIKTLYLNLEDDIAKIAAKIKREKADEVVLVFPKKSFIFSDSINLRLLKKQLEPLGKKVSILTMDEMGQAYAKEAGFELKFLPKSVRPGQFSDIRRKAPEPVVATPSKPPHTAAPHLAKKSAAAPVVSRPKSRLLPLLDKPASGRSSRSWRKILIGFVALALIIIIALVIVVLPGADIKVYAKSQTIARDIDLNVDVKTATADSAKLALPAVAVDQTQDASNTFQAEGKNEVGTKSQGRVAIYNLTGAPLNLRATTTVLSVGSKNYTFNEDQNGIRTLPSATQDQNASVADITAQGGGESFNLPAGTRLEITNQSFGSQPQRLYAKTVSQVVGGASRFVSVISHDDVVRVQNEMNKSVLDNIRNDLKSRNLTLLDDAYIVTPSEFATDKPEGTETPTFNAKTKVRIQGLALDQNQLITLLRDRLALSLSGNQALQDAGQDAVTIKVRNLDIVGGILALSIHYESKAIPQLDVGGVRQQIAGKSKQEAGEVLLSNPDIERVDITLSPVWQTTVPRLTNKIKLEVKK